VDEEVRICVRGLLPHQVVLIRAETRDDDNRVWKSDAKLRADISGTLNLAQKESIGGAYFGLS
jgi:Acyl-CoA thioester hydrolase/BAAT N-terminal region